ncbi:WXG100 family type VII secretion target [Holdemania massiliensis]|uniref:WXG100 family type VII secretion target n=1 Tax=Holdemania massiliensis TaxID=1468449 RepID=UPI0002F06EB1|nr:WXG100 family type VII secretion target [Holdemania massiliensis]
MTDMILKVQPNVLISKASEMATQKNTIISIMEQCKTEINSLQAGWKSQASDEFQIKFKGVYDDIDNMAAIIDSYIKTVNELANIYEQAEKRATAAAEGLPTDGVFKM